MPRSRRTTTVEPINIHPSFDHASKKYRCCFGRGLHIRTCAILIGTMEILSVGFLFPWSLTGAVYFFRHPPTVVRNESYPRSPSVEFVFDEKAMWSGDIMAAASRLVTSRYIGPEFIVLGIGASFIMVSVGVSCMFRGIYKTRSDDLFLHLLLQGIFATFLFGVAIAYAAAPNILLSMIPYRWLAVLIFVSVGVCDVYFLYLIRRCSKYLTDKENAIILARPTVPRDDLVATVI